MEMIVNKPTDLFLNWANAVRFVPAVAKALSGFSGVTISPLRWLFQTQCLWCCISIGGFYCGNT